MAYLDKIGLERLWQHMISRIGNKVDKVDGKGLSTNDYTTEEKEKLAGIDVGAQINIPSDWNASEGEPGYVANRTHYKKYEKWYADGLENFSFSGNSKTGIVYGYLNSETEYIVELDGVKYTAVSQLIGDDMEGYVLLGDSNLIDYPFFIDYNLELGLYDTIRVSTEGEHILSVYEEVELFHGIDERFIPSTIARTSDIDNFYAPIDSPAFINSINFNRKPDTTVGFNSVALGYSVEASGYFSFAEGNTTTASGQAAHAEGMYTTASNMSAHAEGNNTTASAHAAHAEGIYTTASGLMSHAEGNGTTANNDMTHAEGYGTIASGKYQHAQGKFNVEDSEGKYAHIVGNGENTNNPSNAHTLDWNGNAWFQGVVKVGGANQDDQSAKELATQEYVDTVITNLVNSAPETLDTLGELAAAFEDNKEVVDVLNASITNKQNIISDSLILVDTITGL